MSKLWAIPAALFIAALVMLSLTFHADESWVALHSGTHYLQCGKTTCADQIYYNFWSGPGSDLGEITLITAVLSSAGVAYKVRECQNETCHWPAQHVTKDGHKLCKKCIGKPRHALSLHFIHPHHQMTSVERANAGISDHREGDQDAGTTGV